MDARDGYQLPEPSAEGTFDDESSREELRRLLRELRPNPAPGRVPRTLGEAAARGDLDLVRMFLEDGASVDEGYRDGWYPIERARKEGHEEVVSLLLARGAEERRARLGTVSKLIDRWLPGAAEESLATEFMEPESQTRAAPKSAAEQKRRVDRVIELIQAGVLGDDPAAFKIDRDFILPFACEYGLHEVVEALLDLGLPPVCPPAMRDGQGPLTEAAGGGFTEIVRLLLESGADANVPDQKDRRRLPLGAAAERGDLELVRLLLDAGADPRDRSDSGTALQLAAGPQANAVRTLLESHARTTGAAHLEPAVMFRARDSRLSMEGVRAFHEHWCPYDFRIILAKAPIDAVGKAYSDLAGADRLEQDLSHRGLREDITGHFLLQMRGCLWTAVLLDLGGGDLGSSGVEIDGLDLAHRLSRRLDTEVIFTSAYDGESSYQLYDKGRKSEGFDEAAELEAIDGADEKRLEAAEREAARRYHECFESRSIWLPAAEEDRGRDGTRLALYGVEAGRVERVDFAVFQQ